MNHFLRVTDQGMIQIISETVKYDLTEKMHIN